MWANTAPDGGLIVIGMEDKGPVSGCMSIGIARLNEIERAGEVYSPDARYDSKRIAATRTDGSQDFLLLIRVYYRPDRLVRNINGEAFTRLGDSKKKLTPEKRGNWRSIKARSILSRNPLM
jgi:ATP-dependent DNA helicase RecG